MDDDELLAELGGAAGAPDITELRHVRTSADKRAAEEIANRTKCEEFDQFKPLFVQIKNDLDTGVRQTRPFQTMAEIKQGEFFIVGGQIAYVADVGEEFTTEYDRRDSRLRVIYDNGTESDVLLRSLQRALHHDEAGRRITDPAAGPLFAGESTDGDLASGTIYVLRSKSDDPIVAANRDVLHKIGVTGGDVKQRIANAKLDPTFLMADVEIVATYELYNINRNGSKTLSTASLIPRGSTSRSRIVSATRSSRANGSSCRFSSSTKLSSGSRMVRLPSHIYDPKAAALVNAHQTR